MEKIINFAHRVLKEHISEKDICLDMTLGNGKDSKFLIELAKFVYCFDIQQIAIDNSKKLLSKSNKNNYQLILDSHENFAKYINDKIQAAIFNLGYLPRGDKSITTNSKVTLLTIKKLLPYLNKNGVCIIVLYPGHSEGKKESILISEYVKSLNQKEFEVVRYEFYNQINNPPYLYVIEKII